MGTGRRLHPQDNEPHRRGVRLGLERSVSRLGNIGGTVHPADRRPGCIGNRLDQAPQAGVLVDGDGEADIHLTTGGDESVDVEAAVGPRRELPAGPGMATPAHRFTQEVVGAPSGVGAALAQPGHQHVAGAGGDGQQRVIAPRTGVAMVAGTLLGQSVGLADGGVQVNGQGPVAWSRPGLPGPGQQLVSAHERMLTGGFYAELELAYDATVAEEKGGRPFGIEALRPIQLSKRRMLDDLAAGRKAFATDQ